MFEDSSCERSGFGGESVVSMGVGRFGGRSSIGTGGSMVGTGRFGVGGSGFDGCCRSRVGEGVFMCFCVAERVFGAGVWERGEVGMVLIDRDFRCSLEVRVSGGM